MLSPDTIVAAGVLLLRGAVSVPYILGAGALHLAASWGRLWEDDRSALLLDAQARALLVEGFDLADRWFPLC